MLELFSALSDGQYGFLVFVGLFAILRIASAIAALRQRDDMVVNDGTSAGRNGHTHSPSQPA